MPIPAESDALRVVAKIVAPSRAELHPLRTIPAAALRIYQHVDTGEWFFLQSYGPEVESPRIPHNLSDLDARTQDIGDVEAILRGWSNRVELLDVHTAIDDLHAANYARADSKWLEK